MTTSYSLKEGARYTTSFRVDLLRFAANLVGLCGAFFILFTAGSSDAGLISLPDLFLRLTLGFSLLFLWRALSFFAGELDRRARRRLQK